MLPLDFLNVNAVFSLSANRARSARLRLALAALSIFTLLWAQAAGYAHRIAHPRTLLPAPHAEQGFGEHHDCAAFDAATLGDGPPQLLFLPAAWAVAALCHRFSSVPRLAALVQLGYRSRAPPLFL